jgi:uncharacterized membrane protein YoaT (DUF817 family)
VALPGKRFFKIANVPLFAGFMYSAVGSYIARVWRIFDFRFSNFPKEGWMVTLSALIYANFFTHHYVWDLRYLLLAATFLLFARTWVHFRVDKLHRRMPLIAGLILVSAFIWLAENISTFAHVWLYPAQKAGWQLVSPNKVIAWYLLMMISFVLVSLIHLPVKRMETEEFPARAG